MVPAHPDQEAAQLIQVAWLQIGQITGIFTPGDMI